MTQRVFKIWLLFLLCGARVPGQSVDCDLPSLENQAQLRMELDVWQESLNRGPCAVAPRVVRRGLVSARTLAHKPLPKARQEFDRGIRARRKGLAGEALEHFADAARLDPDFVDAHSYAGLAYVEARQPSRALPYYQQAVRLEPANPVLLFNLAGVLLGLHLPAEAESVARRALPLDPASVETHYVLGLALVAQEQATSEAAAHLKVAAERYPFARQMLEWIHGQVGNLPHVIPYLQLP